MRIPGRSILLLLAFAAMAPSGAVAQVRTVLVVTEPWEPYMGPTLPSQGFLAEVAVAAFKKAGYAATVEFIPWARALDLVEKGRADCLLGAYYSDERTKWLAYPDPVTVAQTVVVALKERALSYKTVKDLEAYTVGIVRAAAHSKDFDEDKAISKREVEDIATGLKMLVGRRFDLLAGPRDVIAFTLKAKLPESVGAVVVLQPPLDEQRIYCGVSKKLADSTALVTAFNKGLAAIKADGSFAAIAKRQGF